jgi:hypothetical protein
MQTRMNTLFEINRWLRVRKEAQCRVDLLV